MDAHMSASVLVTVVSSQDSQVSQTIFRNLNVLLKEVINIFTEVKKEPHQRVKMQHFT